MTANAAPKSIKTQVPSIGELPVPIGANFFHITRVNTEYEVLIGNVSLAEVHVAVRGEEDILLSPQITHRLLLSEFGFDKLVKSVTEMAEKVKARGEGGPK